MTQGSGRSPAPLQRAFDELRFGRERTLNLRLDLPTPQQACTRAESWLRERQVSRAGEVLIITGRGNSSHDGISVVRVAVHRLLLALRRRGVVDSIAEHTPGSFVVTLAPLRALRDAPRRLREPNAEPKPRQPQALAGLEPEKCQLLSRLAELALGDIGVRDAQPFLEREMLTQLSRLAPALRESGDRERQLQEALRAAIEEHENG
jgi:hypothetical protein